MSATANPFYSSYTRPTVQEWTIDRLRGAREVITDPRLMAILAGLSLVFTPFGALLALSGYCLVTPATLETMPDIAIAMAHTVPFWIVSLVAGWMAFYLTFAIATGWPMEEIRHLQYTREQWAKRLRRAEREAARHQ